MHAVLLDPMPHCEGYPLPSTAKSSNYEQPSPISSFDSYDASEKVEKERGRAIRRRTNRPPVGRLLKVVRARARLKPVPEGEKGNWIKYKVTPLQYLCICNKLELKLV